MKHYGNFLFDAGKGVKYKSSDLEILYNRKHEFKKKLKNLLQDIEIAEKEFANYIKDDWTIKEIEFAKNKALAVN